MRLIPGPPPELVPAGFKRGTCGGDAMNGFLDTLSDALKGKGLRFLMVCNMKMTPFFRLSISYPLKEEVYWLWQHMD